MLVMSWEPIPNYCVHMTLEEWKECCDCGGFIDYDGYGNLATLTAMSNIKICPSDYTDGDIEIDPMFTHVVWFNR